jgi:hypothetical protein
VRDFGCPGPSDDGVPPVDAPERMERGYREECGQAVEHRGYSWQYYAANLATDIGGQRRPVKAM